jgi:hypothetical protein
MWTISHGPFHLHNKNFVDIILSKYGVHTLIDVVIAYHTHADFLLLTISTLSFGALEVMSKQREKITKINTQGTNSCL